MNELFRKNFLHPVNSARLDAPSCSAEYSSPFCGDMITFDIAEEDGVIKQAGYEIYGCSVAVAAASLFSQMITGADRETADSITCEELAEKLGITDKKRFECIRIPLNAYRRARLGETHAESNI